MIHKRTIDSYCFGFSSDLTESQLRPLTDLFHGSDDTGVAVLGGRTAVTPARLEGIGAVVIKHYRRGGLLRHLNKRRYLKFGRSRAQREFELLNIVAELNVNVPQPIAFACRGMLFCQAWLITRAIRQPVSLTLLSRQDANQTSRAMESVINQISALIQNRILHHDLHPGNVIVDHAGKVYLLDFDKGRFYHGRRQNLKKRYLARWQRAVNKHGLPSILIKLLQDGLN
ncbi:hypothetical protein D1AOALGA4SA_11875 [Olavius algarvensis Delta 1 endosymbiont]|nr:hypothetical protein D1AOALGA4SA_11875 [Olavius algarvensis Delta 1 endosymbiont]